MTATSAGVEGPPPEADELLALLRRVVGARVGGHPDAEDLVQEAYLRVLAASDRIDPGMVEAYAVTTARNLVASHWRQGDRFKRHQHRLVDLDEPDDPVRRMEGIEDQGAMARALATFTEDERELLVAHEVHGTPTAKLAAEQNSTAGAVAAKLHRLRARLRVEYLLAHENVDLPSDECRPVLVAVSLRDRRRQRETKAENHRLRCEVCQELALRLEQQEPERDDFARIRIAVDADIVTARQKARELASTLGFPGVDLTVIATAVSEMTRNIVRFAGEGQVEIELVNGEAPGRRGVQVIVRDAGPGIPDIEAAMRDGYSTYHGLGLGLPGARRLMDDFELVTADGRGTTITMTKWQQGAKK